MAEENAAVAAEAKKGSPWLLAFAVGILGALVGGGGAFIAVSRTQQAQEANAASEPTSATEPTASFAERVHSLEPFVVNVSGEGYPRYVKLQLAFELDSPEARAELEERIAKVRDLTILLLSSKRLSDIEDFEGKALLKDDLRERVNAVLKTGTVESVLFTEFVVQ